MPNGAAERGWRSRSTGLRLALLAAGVAALYFVAAKAGLALASVNPSATAVWPPTGIALAALLVLGYRLWPGVLLGAFVANITTAGNFATAAAIAGGNTLEALAAAWLVNRYAGGETAFSRAPDVFRAALLAGLVATTISATIGVGTLLVAGLATSAQAGPIWITWWLGDAGGALVVAPLLLLWIRGPRPSLTIQRVLEAGILLAILLAGCFAAFAGLAPGSLRNAPVEFFLLPPIVWAAYRFGPAGASSATVIVAAIAVPGTLAGHGPFAVLDANEALLALQAFVAVVSISALALGAEAEERRATTREVRRAHDELDLLVRQRTATLARTVAQLEEANRALARSNESLQAFAYVVSHDLKEPVRAVDAYLAAAREEATPGATADNLARAAEAQQRLAALLSSLLELSSTARHVAADELARVDIAEATRAPECAGRYSDLLERRGASLEVVTAPGTPAALATPSAIRQIIGNLVVNAVKHNPNPTPLVRVTIAPSPQGDWVETVVEDNGPGFSPEAFAHAGADGTPRWLLVGSFGLVIVRRAVELLGGRLYIERSEALGGAAVRVVLPVAR